MKTLTLNFILKKSSYYKDGRIPVNLRLTVDSERAEISTKFKVLESAWDQSRQIVRGRSTEAINTNQYLTSLKNQAQQEFNSLVDTQTNFTVKVLKDALNGKSKKHRTLIEVFEENNRIMRSELGINYVKEVVNRYDNSLNRLKEFLMQDLSGSRVRIDQLDKKFILRYEHFLFANYPLTKNSAINYLKQLKKVVHMAMSYGYIDKDPFLGYNTSYKETNRGYLTMDELNKLKNFTFSNITLEKVRDVFLFGCYTGLSYTDLKNLSNIDIEISTGNKRIIVINRQKTKIRSVIPLLSDAEEILSKYTNDPNCSCKSKLLPVLSNQKMNLYLKVIGPLCGISTKISMHLSRHSFSTTIALSNGTPIETVQKILGHKKIQTTMIYAKVVDSKVIADMEKLDKKLL